MRSTFKLSPLSKLRREDAGQIAAIRVLVSAVIMMVIGIIVLSRLFLSGVAPTDNADDPDYDAEALDAYNNTKAMAWVAIGLMSVGILLLGALIIMSFMGGGQRGP